VTSRLNSDPNPLYSGIKLLNMRTCHISVAKDYFDEVNKKEPSDCIESFAPICHVCDDVENFDSNTCVSCDARNRIFIFVYLTVIAGH